MEQIGGRRKPIAGQAAADSEAYFAQAQMPAGSAGSSCAVGAGSG